VEKLDLDAVDVQVLVFIKTAHSLPVDEVESLKDQGGSKRKIK